MKETGRPWRVEIEDAEARAFRIAGVDNATVIWAEDADDRAEGDLRLIVRAVNAHEGLVGAVRDLLDLGFEGGVSCDKPECTSCDDRVNQAREALALAERDGDDPQE